MRRSRRQNRNHLRLSLQQHLEATLLELQIFGISMLWVNWERIHRLLISHIYLWGRAVQCRGRGRSQVPRVPIRSQEDGGSNPVSRNIGNSGKVEFSLQSLISNRRDHKNLRSRDSLSNLTINPIGIFGEIVVQPAWEVLTAPSGLSGKCEWALRGPAKAEWEQVTSKA